MTKPPRQLTLDWPHKPSFAREDFLLASSNQAARAAIDRWPAWPGRMLLLAGPEGAGKSHLASIWAEKAGAAVVHADKLNDLEPDIHAHGSAFVIEDADRVDRGEERLFHLLNTALQSSAWVLLTARTAPDAWALAIPDLLSRLRIAPVIRLEAPDLELTEAVLFKLFSDRQLQVDAQIVNYIAMRIERSLGAARELVGILDREALARGQRVTRAMAGELLRETPAQRKPP